MELQQVCILDCEEFNDLINNMLVCEYEFDVVANMNWSRGSDHYFSDVSPMYFDEHDQEILATVLTDPTVYRGTEWLIIELVNQGYIEPGNYLIQVG